MPSPADLGQILRRKRRQQGHSLAAVASATGISSSFLSLVEKGESDITFGRLVVLMDFYGIAFDELVVGDGEPADRRIVRADEQRHVYSPAEHIDVFLLAPDAAGAMKPTLGVFEPGGEAAEAYRPRGDEFIHVLQGTVTLELADGEVLALAQGDSVYFGHSESHRIRNPGEERAVILAVETR